LAEAEQGDEEEYRGGDVARDGTRQGTLEQSDKLAGRGRPKEPRHHEQGIANDSNEETVGEAAPSGVEGGPGEEEHECPKSTDSNEVRHPDEGGKTSQDEYGCDRKPGKASEVGLGQIPEVPAK
jgi:hypothetical protein